MAITTTYNYKGLEVNEAIIRVERLFGSSKDGWDSLVKVYNKDYSNPIDEFNFKAEFKEDERGYITIYKALVEKFGGIEI